MAGAEEHRRVLYRTWLDIQERLHNNEYRYYTPIRHVLGLLKVSGDVLWTELYKCENMPSVKRLVPAAASHCQKVLLREEIESFRKERELSVAIANGRDTYLAILESGILCGTVVIGIPHTTGSRGLINYFYEGNSPRNARIKSEYVEQIRDAIRAGRSHYITVKKVR